MLQQLFLSLAVNSHLVCLGPHDKHLKHLSSVLFNITF